MRRVVYLASVFLALMPGCGEPAPTAAEPPLTADKQEAEATRVFELAQRLEKEKKPRDAIASYRHIVRSFPTTKHSKKASERLKKIQGML